MTGGGGDASTTNRVFNISSSGSGSGTTTGGVVVNTKSPVYRTIIRPGILNLEKKNF